MSSTEKISSAWAGLPITSTNRAAPNSNLTILADLFIEFVELPIIVCLRFGITLRALLHYGAHYLARVGPFDKHRSTARKRDSFLQPSAAAAIHNRN